MVLMLLLFLIQFSVACACLSVGDEQITAAMEYGWSMASNNSRIDVQNYANCCGFNSYKEYFLQGVNGTSSADFSPVCSNVYI